MQEKKKSLWSKESSCMTFYEELAGLEKCKVRSVLSRTPLAPLCTCLAVQRTTDTAVRLPLIYPLLCRCRYLHGHGDQDGAELPIKVPEALCC